jgi:hypothetical protein
MVVAQPYRVRDKEGIAQVRPTPSDLLTDIGAAEAQAGQQEALGHSTFA